MTAPDIATAAGGLPDDGARRRRARMRAWRRGTKEMDLVLGPWADAELAGLDAARLDAFERLLGENDQDLYTWIAGQAPAPAAHAPLIARIATFAHARFSPAEGPRPAN